MTFKTKWAKRKESRKTFLVKQFPSRRLTFRTHWQRSIMEKWEFSAENPRVNRESEQFLHHVGWGDELEADALLIYVNSEGCWNPCKQAAETFRIQQQPDDAVTSRRGGASTRSLIGRRPTTNDADAHWLIAFERLQVRALSISLWFDCHQRWNVKSLSMQYKLDVPWELSIDWMHRAFRKLLSQNLFPVKKLFCSNDFKEL